MSDSLYLLLGKICKPRKDYQRVGNLDGEPIINAFATYAGARMANSRIVGNRGIAKGV